MDKHSKRNRSKDNPYRLSYSETSSSYIVEFKDNKNITHKVEISDEVYKAFDEFELEDISQIHKYRKHIEHNEIYEETLYHKAVEEIKSVEQEVEDLITIESLKEALDTLSDIQKRRIKMYYFDNMTLQEIAIKERCHLTSVKESIDSGIKKLRKFNF